MFLFVFWIPAFAGMTGRRCLTTLLYYPHMRDFRACGIVLGRRDYAEGDRILRILTRELGLVSVLAKGIRKPASRKRTALEPFCKCAVQLYRGTGELYLATNAHLERELLPLGCRLPEIALAYTAAEWVLELVPEEKECEEIFLLLEEFLHVLPYAKKPRYLLLGFQTKLLVLLGYLELPEAMDRHEKLARGLLQLSLAESQAIVPHEETEVRLLGKLGDAYGLATRGW